MSRINIESMNRINASNQCVESISRINESNQCVESMSRINEGPFQVHLGAILEAISGPFGGHFGIILGAKQPDGA